MAIIRRVFGPFRTSKDTVTGFRNPEMRWHFFGIRGDYTTAHWDLVFRPEDRKWFAINNPVGQNLGGRSMLEVCKTLPNMGRSETAHPKAWLDDTPPMEGRIVDILKSKLPPADIAAATALLIRR